MMQTIFHYEIDPANGSIICPICKLEMAMCETKHGFACDEPRGHFLPAKYVPEYGGRGD